MNDGLIISRQMKISSSTEWKLLYKQYLQTEHWKMKRFRTLHRANFICQKCKLKEATQVHHLTYERLGSERRADTIALCQPCHKSEHINPTITFIWWFSLLNDQKIRRRTNKFKPYL